MTNNNSGITPDAQGTNLAVASETGVYSIDIFNRHIHQAGSILTFRFDPIVGGMRHMFDFDLPLITELATARDFDDGTFSTDQNAYFIFRDEDYAQITSFDGEHVHLRFLEASAFHTPEKTLSFLRTMNSKLIDNVDPSVLNSHLNLLQIIAQATVELLLARHTELNCDSDTIVEVYVSAKSKLDGSITIELGPCGWQPTGVCIDTNTLIISVGYDDQITGPYVRIEEKIPSVSSIEAMRLQKSAAATFAELGLTDLSPLIRQIDEYFEDH